MAHNDASKPSKLIFAPGENHQDAHDTSPTNQQPQTQQAAQFQVGTLHRKDLEADPFVQFHKWFSDPALKGKVPETVTLSTAELPSGRVSSRMVYLKELDDKGFVIYSNWGTSRKAHDIATNPYASLCFWWKPLERQVRVSGPAHRLTSAESQTYYDTRARGSRIGAWASQQSQVLKPQQESSTTKSLHQETNPAKMTETAAESATATATPEYTNQNTTIDFSHKSNDPIEDQDEDEDDGRQELENQVAAVRARFDNVDDIPVPDFWGGLRVVPERIEFWQGRDSRLHDRFEYVRRTGGGGAAEEEAGDGVKDSEGWTVSRLSP